MVCVHPPRLKELYQQEVTMTLIKKFGFKNLMQVPKISKIVLNMSIKEAIKDRKHLIKAMDELSLISGQRPIRTIAKRSIAAFKLREGMGIGCKVTLRRDRMYEFLDRLINIALPRVRDFRGLNSKSFDGNGNYAMGLKEQIVFPEIDYDIVSEIRGMNIVICTSTNSDDQAKALLQQLNMPFAA